MTLKAYVWWGPVSGEWWVDIYSAERTDPALPTWGRGDRALISECFDTHAEAIAWAWEQVAETCPGQG